jgi:hypothetical protein
MAKTASLPYPRPVSPLDVEEAPFCEGDIVYVDWKDDTDSEAAERAAKRRKRIQQHAEAYMRGDNIMVMTANLKGPFDGKWKNPWKRKSRVSISVSEVPETTALHKHKQPKEVSIPETSRPYVNKSTTRTTKPDDIEFTQEPLVQEHPPTNIFKKKQPTGKVAGNQLTPTSTRRIEDWLRRNDAYSTERVSDIRSSPMLASRATHLLTPDTSSRRPASAGGRQDNTQVGDWASRFNGEGRREVTSMGSDNHSSILRQPTQQSTQQTHESQTRAEAAIVQQKLRSVHRLPESTNLPAFEYRRARPEANPATRDLPPESVNRASAVEANTSGQVVDPRVPQDSPRVAAVVSADVATKTGAESHSNAVPLSAEASRTKTGHIQSAQAQPAMTGMPSLAPSTADLLLPLDAPPDSAVLISATGKDQAVAAVSTADQSTADVIVPVAATDLKPKLGRQSLLAQEAGDAASKHAGTPARAMDTQALLGSIKPFEMSTVKQLKVTDANMTTPPTATKKGLQKKPSARPTKKKASFAADANSDDSQSSITAGLKVRKQTLNTANARAASKMTSFEFADEEERYNLDPASGANENVDSLPSVSAMFKTTPTKGGAHEAAPKSILKTRAQPEQQSMGHATAQPGTTATISGVTAPAGGTGTYQSTSGSRKQDAQLVAQQLDMFAIENGTVSVEGAQRGGEGVGLEQFDLDAVVDDLGSYLGTWDAEREANLLSDNGL